MPTASTEPTRSARLRRFTSSIRFRLSLAVSVSVFAVGAFFIGAIYLWQVNRLEPPVVETRQVAYVDPVSGRELETVYQLVFPEDLQVAVAVGIEQHAYRDALDQLRRASFYALGLLAVTSFATGWIVSGWTLGPVTEMVAVARDISANDLSRRIRLRGPDDELKELADTFDDMVDRLQTAFEDQRRLVHDTSHELRNPLAVSRANLELAIDGGDLAEVARAAAVALHANERMAALVDDLVDQARDGVPEVALETVDLAGLSEAVVGEQAAGAAERSVRLVAGADAPVSVRGERAALRRVVSNLVENSVRHAPAGSEVLVVAEADVAGGVARVSVRDAGPGIDPADHARIFERFERAGGGTGLGLGLAIVKRVVVRHGGEVTVDSTLGEGATFTVRLPLLAAPAVADDPTSATLESAS